MAIVNAVLLVLLSCNSWSASGLNGGAFSGIDGANGWALDFGNGWSKDSMLGLHGGPGRMYLMQNYLAGSWDQTDFHRIAVFEKTISFTVDLSNVGCGVIACLYFADLPHPGGNSARYCDIKQGCRELDIMEANSHGFESSLHSHSGTDFGGSCNENGCSTNIGRYPYTVENDGKVDALQYYGPGKYINSNKPFDVEATFDEVGVMSVVLRQGDAVLPTYNKSSAWNFAEVQDAYNKDTYPKPGGIPDWEVPKTQEMFRTGMALVASLWSPYGDSHWLDGTACKDIPPGTCCQIGSASFTIKNLTLGPARTPAPTPAPPTPPPTPAPPPPECETATPGSKCYKHVRWAMEHGINDHPEWYPGLNELSSFDKFQMQLFIGGHGHCNKPCGSEFETINRYATDDIRIDDQRSFVSTSLCIVGLMVALAAVVGVTYVRRLRHDRRLAQVDGAREDIPLVS